MEVTKALLEKYLSGQCTPDERAYIEAYLKRTKNTDLLNELLWQYWEQAPEQAPEAVDVDGSLARFKEKRKNAPVDKSSKFLVHPATRRIAASLLLLLVALGAAAWWYTNHSQSLLSWFTPEIIYKEFYNSTGRQVHFTLSDGSQVWLNVDSHIKYPESFQDSDRNVYLTGEAVFDVTKNPQKPFRVFTRHLKTTVLGTSFQVSAYDNDQLAQVTVATGKVAVEAIDSASQQVTKQYVLHPWQRVVLDKESRQMRQDSTDLLEVAALKKGELYLRDMTFEEIARRLERWYDVTIIFEKEVLKDCSFSATFKSRSLQDVLDRLQLTSTFRYKIRGKLVYIKGDGCG